MNRKMLLVMMFGMLALLAIGIAAASHSGKKIGSSSSSPEENSAAVTEFVLTPSQIPSRIHADIPGGFEAKSSDAYDKYFVKNDASVIITGEAQPGIGGQTEYYTEQVKKMYEQTADEFSIIKDEVIVINGQPGHLLEFSYAIIGKDVKQPMRCMTGLFVKDDYVYVITCKSKLETFSNYRENFMQIINSVTIDDPTIPADAYINGDVSAVMSTAVTATETTKAVLHVN